MLLRLGAGGKVGDVILDAWWADTVIDRQWRPEFTLGMQLDVAAFDRFQIDRHPSVLLRDHPFYRCATGSALVHQLAGGGVVEDWKFWHMA